MQGGSGDNALLAPAPSPLWRHMSLANSFRSEPGSFGKLAGETSMHATDEVSCPGGREDNLTM